MVGQCIAVLFGALTGALLSRYLTQADLETWGWRIPFIIGLLICPVGLWMRRNLDENDEYIEALKHIKNSKEQQQTIFQNVKSSVKQIFLFAGINATATTGFYIIFMHLKI